MKFQIDTDKKTIKIEDNVKFSELLKNLNLLFPEGEWKEYTLLTNVIINWTSNPIIVNPSPYNPHPLYPTQPWWQVPNSCISVTKCSTGTINASATNSVYNVQVKN